MTAPTFDYDNVRDISDVHPLPGYGFRRDSDTGELPDGCQWLGHVSHGSQVADETGERFRVMGYGAVQGTVVLRNRYRQLFYCDTNLIVRVVSPATR